MKNGFEKLYRLIFRKAARHEQQNMPGKGDVIQPNYFQVTKYYRICPAPIQMGNIGVSNAISTRMQYMRSDSQGPPDYGHCRSPEEPLPLYKP